DRLAEVQARDQRPDPDPVRLRGHHGQRRRAVEHRVPRPVRLDDGVAVPQHVEPGPPGIPPAPSQRIQWHMSDGFDFLGFRIQWRRKRGTNKWYVYTFIAQRPIRSLKAKARALTHRTSQQDLRYVLTMLGQVMHGWASYFRHAVAKHTFSMLDHFA